MSNPVQYCNRLPPHASRRCTECKRIQMAVYRGKSIEEARGGPDPKQPTCRSCRMRFFLEPPEVRPDYSPVLLTAGEVRWLENAARHFDQISGSDRWTAEDFIAWLKPDLSGRYGPQIPEFVGIRKTEGGNRTGTMATRHGSPDPLPMVPAGLRKLVS